MNDLTRTIAELTRAKAVFQQRAIATIVGERPSPVEIRRTERDVAKAQRTLIAADALLARKVMS